MVGNKKVTIRPYVAMYFVNDHSLTQAPKIMTAEPRIKTTAPLTSRLAPFRQWPGVLDKRVWVYGQTGT